MRDRTIEFLAHHRDRSRPLFLVVSFPHPHPPVNPPEPYASMYDPADCHIDPEGSLLNRRLPASFRRETEQADHPHRRVDPGRLDHHRSEIARTYGLITQIDDAVGEIVTELDLADAIVWFTSDHGDYGGRRGLVRKIPWIPFDDLARVPTFVTGGIVTGPPRREPSPTQSFDFATTCLDLSGAASDLDLDMAQFDGVTQRSLIEDTTGDVTAPPDRMVWSAVSMNWPMARRGPHKYVRGTGWGEEVLFDVEGDPDESIDLARHPFGVDLTRELSAAVDRQLSATAPDLPRL